MLKTKRIGLLVTEEEKKFVIELARIEGGLSQAALIRRLIHKAAKQIRMDASLSRDSHKEDKSYEQ
jgi:hypothetical protein